jgi:hypothetical protein
MYDEWKTWVDLSELGEVIYNRKTYAFYRQHSSNMRVTMNDIGDFEHRIFENNTKIKAKQIFIKKYGTFLYFLIYLIYLTPARLYWRIKRSYK